jgi:two-component system, chemotaxis family, CheB/CheR fusion protein
VAETVRDEAFESLLTFIRDKRGFDFTGYKRPSLQRRVSKRMQDLGVGDFVAYQQRLKDDDDEFAELFDTILINVTSFFRDEVSWDFLAEQIVPGMLETKDPAEAIRVWSTGCASGEEAYTLAIVLAEALGEEALRSRVKIYATDVDEGALTQGRHATYDPKAVEAVPEELRNKYFERVNSSFVFRADLRRSVIFGRHDLINDPPISRVDLLVSRNTLMYFDADTQGQILRSFHFALRNHGVLFLGKAEAIANRSQLFEPVDLKRRVFRKVPREERRPVRAAPAVVEDGHELTRLATEALIKEVGFEAAPVAQLVVDPEGRLTLANLQARMYFTLTPRDIGRPIQDLDISFRPVELRSRIEQSYKERHAITLRDVEWRVGEDLRFVDVQVVPLIASTGEVVGCGITFTDVTRYQRLQLALTESKRDVETAYEELQSTNEELETTNEELQSTNEELETTNEELQSTNEELETMNEELQSTNEELSTINDELQQRTDELNDTNAYLEGILGKLSAAVVVLDREFGIRGWNNGARELWGLVEDEVHGTNFLNLDIGLPVDQLRSPIRKVLSSEEEQQAVTLPALNRRGRQIECRVSMTALGPPDEIRGVILMMEAAEE